jgi:hypothetical protein
MPFFKPKQLPGTSYGYQPPPGATAHGWKCPSDKCGEVGDGVVRGFHCWKCGGHADPVFDEPWAHQARGVELQYQMANDPDRAGFAKVQWPAWRYTDAVLKGDSHGAAQARALARAQDLEESERLEALNLKEKYWCPSHQYIDLVLRELETHRIDDAADDLMHWLSISPTDNVAGNETNSWQAIQMVGAFFSAPGGRQHALLPAIRIRCLEIAAACPFMPLDLRAVVAQLAG